MEERMVGDQKSHPPTSFYPVTSPSTEIISQIFLTFRFDPFATLLNISRPYLVICPISLKLKHNRPAQKVISGQNHLSKPSL